MEVQQQQLLFHPAMIAAKKEKKWKRKYMTS